MSRFLILTSVLCLGLPAFAGALQEPESPEPEAAPLVEPEEPEGAPEEDQAADPAEVEPLPPAVPWLARLVANTELGFTARSAGLARADLDSPDLAEDLRAVALMGLGCSEARSERARLESFAVEGEAEVRTAAVLALGELGVAGHSVAAALIDDPDAFVAECALLAMLRTRRPGDQSVVEAVADDPSHPRSAAAQELLVFALDPTGSAPSRAAGRLLELRLLAARRYGLVRGQAWQVLLLGNLAEDEAFLDRVIHLAAADLHSPGVRDQFLEIVLSGPPHGARRNLDSLRGAVNALPVEMSTMVDKGLWMPRDGQAWNTILDEIDTQRLEGLTDALLRTAWVAIPGLREHASILIVRGGSEEGLSTLELVLEGDNINAWIRVIEVLGGTGQSLYVKTLSELLDHRSTKLASAALVGQVRLDFDEAETRLRRYFRNLPTRADEAAERGEFDDEDPDGDLLVVPTYGRDLITAMCNTVRDPVIREFLLEIFPRLGGDERVEVATALASIGRPETRAVVFEVLQNEPPVGERGAGRVRAVSRSLTLPELGLLRGMFPVEDDFEVNAELAIALTRARDPKILPLLRSALWREPLNRSILAAALLVDVAGIDALREELQHPSLDASVRDLRRVGFALGQFGGIEQVEVLGRRLGSGDPALQGALLGALASRTY